MAALLTLALALALQAQALSSPLAAAWLLPVFAASVVSIYRSGAHRDRGAVWLLSLIWLVLLGTHTFIIKPVENAAATMWILAAAPMIALTLKPEHLQRTLKGAGAVLVLFAFGLLVQEVLDVRYTTSWEHHSGRSWPVLDSNNAAAMINFGLISAFGIGLRKPKYFAFALILAIGLALTNSRAGAIAAVAGCSVIAFAQYGRKFALPTLLAAIIVGEAACVVDPEAVHRALSSMSDRLPIWEASAGLVDILGKGLGSFGWYYAHVRTEMKTAGFYAHNDLVQFAVELGVIGALVFLCLMLAVAMRTTRRNIIPAAALLGVFLQAMMEFQFYVPAVSVLFGIALAWHRYAALYFVGNGCYDDEIIFTERKRYE